MSQITYQPPPPSTPSPASPVIEEPRPRRSLGRRLLTVLLAIVLIIATTVAGSWIIANTPGTQEMAKQFIYPGAVGTVIDHPKFTAQVLGVRGSTKVLDTEDKAFGTDGVFVLVEVRIVAKREPLVLSARKVLDRSGRKFDDADRLRLGITGGYKFEPDIPVEADLAFEIPVDAAVGLRLWLGDTTDIQRNLFQRVVEVNLGVDQATLDKWRAEQRTLEMKLPFIAR